MTQPISAENVEHLSAFLGEAYVYLFADKPADGALVTMTAGVPSGTGAKWLGLTSGDTEVDITQTVGGMKVEQGIGKMQAPRVTDEAGTVKVPMAEATYINFQRAMAAATSGTDSTAHLNWVKIGGKTRVAVYTVTVVSPVEQSDGSIVYEYVHLYQAFADGGVKIKYGQGKNRIFEVTFKAVEDLTRSRGDRLAQYASDSNIVVTP